MESSSGAANEFFAQVLSVQLGVQNLDFPVALQMALLVHLIVLPKSLLVKVLTSIKESGVNCLVRIL